jgi:ion channel
MPAAEILAGILILALVQYDVFQTVIVPRPSTSGIGIARYVIVVTWPAWRRYCESIAAADARERRLGAYAPFMLVFLLFFWILTLILGYALIFYGLRDQVTPPPADLWTALYFAGTSFLTIGFGDVTPTGLGARIVALAAGANGLVLVALAITFLFSLYGSFQRREVLVVTLDARAGAPPSGVQLLEKLSRLHLTGGLPALFAAWETWSAEVLDSHLAYPLLCFFRSSHDNESWVSALGALLDAATLCITTVEDDSDGAAHTLVGLGSHLVEDVTRYFRMPHEHGTLVERPEFDAARARLAAAGWRLRDAERSWTDFDALRARYASDLNAMARFWSVPPAQWIGDRSAMRHTGG